MSDQSTLLSLPYIMPAQAQKHLTHNEALRTLDTLVQLSVASASVATAPGAPALGMRYILPAGAAGAWAGQTAGTLAVFEETGWAFLTPRVGWLAWVVDAGALQVHDGAGWIAASAGADLQNLTQLGINAAADATNRLAVAAAATLLTHAGAGHQVKVNKAQAADTASLLFQTGFSGRAEMGTAGTDDFQIKVSADGATFSDAVRISGATGRVELAAPVVLPELNTTPVPPPAGRIAIYARNRAGTGWLDVQSPSGRHFPLQPHFGVNRIATWSPSINATINSNGMPRTAVGTAATPTLATTNLAASMRRWRMTSAATAGSVAEERAASWVCWRGNADGLGGFTYVNRLSMATLQPTGTGFFGLIGSTVALPTNLTLAAVVNAIGIGFDRGTHANWQIVHNDGTGAPTLIDLGAGFPVASTTNVVTLYIAAAPNGTEVGLRVVEEVSGAVAEATITSDLPAATQFLSPRNYLKNGSTAAAVAYDCSGVYVETDF